LMAPSWNPWPRAKSARAMMRHRAKTVRPQRKVASRARTSGADKIPDAARISSAMAKADAEAGAAEAEAARVRGKVSSKAAGPECRDSRDSKANRKAARCKATSNLRPARAKRRAAKARHKAGKARRRANHKVAQARCKASRKAIKAGKALRNREPAAPVNSGKAKAASSKAADAAEVADAVAA